MLSKLAGENLIWTRVALHRRSLHGDSAYMLSKLAGENLIWTRVVHGQEVRPQF